MLLQGLYSSLARENLEKGIFFGKNQRKAGKLWEFSDHFYNLMEKSGNFILPNISDQIGNVLSE